jgi:hypothetical protein
MRPGTGLYDGKNENFTIDWISKGSEYGFVVGEVTATELTVKFINQNCELIHEVVVRK